MSGFVSDHGLKPTPVFNSYWEFAAKRQRMHNARVGRENSTGVDDPILSKYRFTNAYRILDRVSQYLVSNVQMDHGSGDRSNVAFRTLLFKIFNRIDTWELLESELGAIRLADFDFDCASKILSDRMLAAKPIYSAAYIMAAPRLGHKRKHDNHLQLLRNLFAQPDAGGLVACASLEALYLLLAQLPGLGAFLAFQFAIDLGYSDAFALSEANFVVAGPGARDGIAKCFENWRDFSSTEIIMWVAQSQAREFDVRGLDFDGIPGRKLQPIDCQNLFCEVSKYARMVHPAITGVDGRTRIKQQYAPRPEPLQKPVFPSHWNIPDDA